MAYRNEKEKYYVNLWDKQSFVKRVEQRIVYITLVFTYPLLCECLHKNGSAMRIGPVGWAYNTKEDVLAHAQYSAESTHNHPEGIKGAQATALCILMARQGASKDDIRHAIEQEFGYDLAFTCDGIRDSYEWGALCQNTVPQAIVAFLDGKDFEDSIRNAISIGGDSDTLGCITGSIAEAYYGIPKDLYAKGLEYLTPHFKNVVKEFEEKYGRKVI